MGHRFLAPILLAAGSLLLPGLLAGCAGEEVPRQPDVIVLVMDTVRQDFMGFAGHQRPTTPELDRFSEIATDYPRAKATAPWTLPSHASLFTGLYPLEHGARGYWDPSITPEKVRRVESRGNVRGLSQGPTTLAEWLGQQGYRTGAVVANEVFLGERYGVQRGFEHYDLGLEPAPRINERALRWLDAQPAGQPVFLFINYMDAHKPYNIAPVERLGSAGEYDEVLVRRVMEQVHQRDPLLDPQELARIVHWYELGIANLDAAIGDLFDSLRRRGRFDSALILVTSDHGEYFGEHDLFGHSKDVYEEAMAIPLQIKEPGQTQAARDDRLISLKHLPGLIAKHVAPELRPPSFELHTGAPIIGELYGSRVKDLREPWGERFLRIRMAHYEGPWKLIHSSDGHHELFRLDLSGENQDLAAENPRRLSRSQLDLRGIIERGLRTWADLQADSLSAEEAELSPEEIERLESLGYQ
jgi:arylsulfatase A-like enzyme